MFNTSNSIIEKVRLPVGKDEPFYFDVKRDDLINPVISGNKWRKLKYNLLKVQERKNCGVITFGGPFSNHLVATAKASAESGLKSIGIVRGEELTPDSNKTLKACKSFGMELVFISRADYKEKEESNFLKKLQTMYLNYYVVPEGGKNYYGVIGCQEILSETDNNYDHVYLAGGTGTTGAGVLLSASEDTQVNVVSALKGGFLKKEIEQLLLLVLNDQSYVETYLSQLYVHDEGHFGGYAKVPEQLLRYINSVYDITQLKLDPIYTAKAFFQMESDFNNGIIKTTDKVLFIHTGGIQGGDSWRDEIKYLQNKQ